MPIRLLFPLVEFSLLFHVGSLFANTTVIHHFRLGDNDPAAVAGSSTNPITNDIGAVPTPAEKKGISNYGDGGVPGGLFPDSGLAVEFKNVDSRFEAPAALLNVSDNLGIEAYIMPSTFGLSTPDGRPFFNGHHGFPLDALERGYGLVIDGGEYKGLLAFPGPDVLLPTGVAAIPGIPVEMALVRDQGVVTVYVDGFPRISTLVVPMLPIFGDKLSIGNFHHGGPDVPFAGVVDEARIFTFAPGEFDPVVDLLSIPGLRGDFNGNGSLDIDDIDLLSTEVRAATNSARFDLNADAVVNQMDHRVWVNEIRRTYFGDANLDGEFSSSDLVAVFQAGQYETGQPAGWGNGDWNGDGLFNSSDFVTAFDAGGYEKGPRAAMSAVPEPSSTLLTLFAVAALRFRRQRPEVR
jgi:hypothetical protein